MQCIYRWLACTLVLTLSAWLGGTAQAEISAEQQEKVEFIQQSLADAAKLNKDKKYAELAELVGEIQAAAAELETADNASDFKVVLNQARRKLKPLENALRRQKVVIPAAEMGPSFTKEIAPLLVQHCGNCHVRNARGMFSMATYEALLRGSADGVVIRPGMGKESRLIELVAEAQMPPNGNKIPDEAITLLTAWVDAGAKFDGPDKTVNLQQLAGGDPPQPATPALMPTAPKGSETVSFSRDLAPVLAANCLDCHGDRQPRGQLSLSTFRGLLNGGDSGQSIQPGNGAESLLVRKLKGEAGDQMPLGGTPLDPETIAKFETWINEGATFDGPDQAMNTGMVANVYKAKVATHEDLTADRLALAKSNWRLANPEDEARVAETENFTIHGVLSQEKLDELAASAEDVAKQLAGMLKAPKDKPLVKGKITLFVFAKHFEYSEFGQMVEKREIPTETADHWYFNQVDAYACLVLPSSGEEAEMQAATEGQLARVISGLYLDSLGQTIPRWFAEGFATNMGARVSAKDPVSVALDARLLSAVSKIKAADDIIKGDLPAADLPSAYHGFAKFLMQKSGPGGILHNLRKGATFEMSFEQAYKGTPQMLVQAFAKAAGR